MKTDVVLVSALVCLTLVTSPVLFASASSAGALAAEFTTGLNVRSSLKAKKAPPQLNVTSFATCLHMNENKFDLSKIVAAYNLTDNLKDGLLVYLSVYAGERFAIFNINKTQEAAYLRWSPPFWNKEHALAMKVLAFAQKYHRSGVRSLTPGLWFEMARSVCGDDPFCAALISHNVLRLFGRWMKYTDKTGKNYCPSWFIAEQSAFVHKYIPMIHDVMMSLHRHEKTVEEKWGPWYHFFGLFTYALQTDAISGVAKGTSWCEDVVKLNTFLTPFLLPGHHESPIKAEIDAQACQVASAYVQLLSSSSISGLDALCAERSAYVLQYNKGS